MIAAETHHGWFGWRNQSGSTRTHQPYVSNLPCVYGPPIWASVLIPIGKARENCLVMFFLDNVLNNTVKKQNTYVNSLSKFVKLFCRIFLLDQVVIVAACKSRLSSNFDYF